jgi:hypothetical protein
MGNRVPRKSRSQKVSKRAFHRRRSHAGPVESRQTHPVRVRQGLSLAEAINAWCRGMVA